MLQQKYLVDNILIPNDLVRQRVIFLILFDTYRGDSKAKMHVLDQKLRNKCQH